MFAIGGKAGARKPHGKLTVYDAWGQTTEADTLQCCHCGGHFVVSPKILHDPCLQAVSLEPGWCADCGAKTCGRPECADCVPTEKLLESLEKGKLPEQMPVLSRGG